METGEKIAIAALKIKAIKLNPKNPFTWASGYRMPIYNDNRMFLGYPEYRKFISGKFKELISLYGGINCFDIIAGTSTAGISPATTLADNLHKPLIYIRDKPKDHGLKNQIEGIDSEFDLKKNKVLLIEDLISTGGSSVKAVQAIRNANGICNHCFSIFNYGLDESKRMFNGELPYDKEGNKLEFPCTINSLLDYDTLLNIAVETKYINEEDKTMLEEWRADYHNWGEKHGFPKIEK